MSRPRWHVLALKCTGRGGHPRGRSGVAMLKDRLLPNGGCNAGIPETVLDINASLAKTIAIVDGILCIKGRKCV
ncbi:MAG: hypothetical protein GTO53_07125 [Planctomycetales bacterium]|nr:hypothetical protein [Planctomycetales bacterium]NIM08908.1 hypothetical protein [Planctomycetales bacterium]NIN08364.1 hypothetical protein [Planctomycetales bacterium]NIN77492.1 hypothetical protein [Planctomycetales bacterium]NIO34664.1 hypothetical protein [Planctomycetales bacterium]